MRFDSGSAANRVDEYGQRPGACGERELHQHGEDHPAVPVAPGGERVGRAHRVAVPGLAVDVLTLVAVDGVVADECDRAVGNEVPQEEAGQRAPQGNSRPGRA
jgi:hypothetical protein